jgi:type IV secretory pathway TrbF-like protein
MALIPEWRKAWRMTSVQLAALIAAVNAAAVAWSVFQGAVNPLVFATVNMMLSVAVAVARVIQQSKLRDSDQEHGDPQ